MVSNQVALLPCVHLYFTMYSVMRIFVALFFRVGINQAHTGVLGINDDEQSSSA